MACLYASGPTLSLFSRVQVLYAAINGKLLVCPSLTSVGCWLQIITGGARQQVRLEGAYVGRRRNGGFWVPVLGSLFPSVDLEWVFWFSGSPRRPIFLYIYNVARFCRRLPFVLWLSFRACPFLLWSPKYLELDLVQERIDGGLAILAILILDLQSQGTDWGDSPVLQGY